jgi:putative MATE family efflux protein
MENNNDDKSGRGTFRNSRLNRDWTQGSILNNLLTLAWPIVISNSLNMLGPTIDMMWVGKLGTISMAAVSISGQVVMVVQALLQGLFTSLRAMVARRVGEGDEKAANHAFQQAFTVGAVFSVLTAVIGIFFSRQIITLFGAKPEVVDAAVPYTQIQFVGMVTMTVRMLSDATMQSSGDTMNSMRVGVLFRCIHIALCPFLVFGWWIFPRLGVNGAGLTNVISQGIGGALSLWLLMTGRSRLHITLKGFKIDLRNIWLQLKIGIPSSINQMLRSFVGLIIIKFLAPFGTTAIAAHGLGQRIETFLDVGASAVGNAAGALAGINLGARKPERAAKSGWLAVGLATGVMAVISIAILIWAENVVRLFNSDPDLVKIAATFLRIATVSFLSMGPAGVLTTCLNQVGDTMIPLVVSFVTMWGMQLPLAYFLPKIGNMGVYGVRWSMAIALAARAIAYLIYFRTDKWKNRRV